MHLHAISYRVDVPIIWNSKADKIIKLKCIVKINMFMNAWATFKAWSNLLQMHGQPSRHDQNLYSVSVWSTQCECIVKPIHCQMQMHCQHYQMLMHHQQFSNAPALEVRSTYSNSCVQSSCH